MTRKLLIKLLLLLMTCGLCAEEESYFTITYGDDDKVEISVTEQNRRITNAELFRVQQGHTVNIYDLTILDNKFSEPSIQGTCYFLKVYFEDGSVHKTDEKCYSKAQLFKKINISMIVLLIVFLASLLIPVFSNFSIFNYGGKEKTAFLRFIKTLLGENSGSISFLISTGSTGDPVSGSLTKLMDGLAGSLEKGSFIESGFSNNYSSLLNSPEKGSVIFVPQISGLGGLFSVIERRDKNRQLVFNISDGSAFSDWDSYMSGNDRRRVSVSANVAGSAGDSVLSKKSLISVEPFLLNAQLRKLNSQKALKISGIYVFLALVTVIIIVGSVAVTIMRLGAQ